jgi:hypothetical protein
MEPLDEVTRSLAEMEMDSLSDVEALKGGKGGKGGKGADCDECHVPVV